jgi:hypothetical protein
MPSRPIILALAFLVSGLLAVSGCASTITQEQFSQVKEGMALEKVQSILGKGTLQAGAGASVGSHGGSFEVYTWNGPTYDITVTFVSGKVVSTLANWHEAQTSKP